MPESQKMVLRYAGVTMCSCAFFLIIFLGLADVLWQRPIRAQAGAPRETKSTPQPRPVEVELVGLRWDKEARGWPDLLVTVRNTSVEPVPDLTGRPSYWTRDGELIDRSAFPNSPALPLKPGQTATFRLQPLLHTRSAYVTVSFEDSKGNPLHLKETIRARIDLPPSMRFTQTSR